MEVRIEVDGVNVTMKILSKLENNKGTVSSALSKLLAQDILKGDVDILKESIELVFYEDKNVRSGAAKIVEQVAEKKPEYVAPYLNKLLSALEFPESQTRWMIIHVCGLCAKLEPEIAKKALPKSKLFLKEKKNAVCLWDRSITYLGYMGAVSKENATIVFPILERILKSIPKRTSRILEGLDRMIPILNNNFKEKLKIISKEYVNDKSPGIKKKAMKILKRLEEK